MKIKLLFLVAALAALAIASASEHLFSGIVVVKNDTKPTARRVPGLFDRLKIRTDGSPDDTPPPDPPLEVVNGWDKNDIAAQPEADAKAAKGHFATCLLKATDEEAGKAWPDPYKRTPKSARSPFKPSQQDLTDWFWHEASYDQNGACDFTDATRTHTDHLQKSLSALGLSYMPKTMGGDIVCYSIEHSDEHAEDENGYPTPYQDQHYSVNGEKFGATGAWYRFGIDQKGGAIHGLSHEAPAFTAADNWGRRPHANELPHLGKASDIMFFYWARANPNVRNLRYYFNVYVINHETNPLIAKIIHDDPQLDDLPDWPGVKFHEGSSEFNMLLGSPVGMTLAYMILQHKAELGVKHMTDVTVFRDSAAYAGHEAAKAKVMMVWTIKDVERVEDPQGEREDEEMTDARLGVRGFKTGRGERGFTRVHEFRMRDGRMERKSAVEAF
ncbi:hypothetical protein HBI20_177700 [Parastagonospora nodorum]|nr:hypothetical protein HBI20_177700 [Parastagonospora nodorum]